MTDDNSTIYQPVKPRGRKLAILALLLSMVSLGLIGYLYYANIKIQAQTRQQLQILYSTTDTNNRQLHADIAVATQQIETLRAKIDGITTDKFSANNYQINTLVSLANQSLVAFHDADAAIKLLTYAQNIVAANNDPLYTELKVAITTDLAGLKQLLALDKVVIATRLNNIITNVDKLAVIANNDLRPSVAITTHDTLPTWRKFLANVKTQLLALVQISIPDRNNAIVLLPQHEVIIHQNVKLDILNARIALLQNDQLNWQYSLNAARQSLATYFIENPNMKNIMEEISELQQLDISYGDSGIQQTLKVLNKLNNL